MKMNCNHNDAFVRGPSLLSKDSEYPVLYCLSVRQNACQEALQQRAGCRRAAPHKAQFTTLCASLRHVKNEQVVQTVHDVQSK